MTIDPNHQFKTVLEVFKIDPRSLVYHQQDGTFYSFPITFSLDKNIYDKNFETICKKIQQFIQANSEKISAQDIKQFSNCLNERVKQIDQRTTGLIARIYFFFRRTLKAELVLQKTALQQLVLSINSIAKTGISNFAARDPGFVTPTKQPIPSKRPSSIPRPSLPNALSPFKERLKEDEKEHKTTPPPPPPLPLSHSPRNLFSFTAHPLAPIEPPPNLEITPNPNLSIEKLSNELKIIEDYLLKFDLAHEGLRKKIKILGETIKKFNELKENFEIHQLHLENYSKLREKWKAMHQLLQENAKTTLITIFNYNYHSKSIPIPYFSDELYEEIKQQKENISEVLGNQKKELEQKIENTQESQLVDELNKQLKECEKKLAQNNNFSLDLISTLTVSKTALQLNELIYSADEKCKILEEFCSKTKEEIEQLKINHDNQPIDQLSKELEKLSEDLTKLYETYTILERSARNRKQAIVSKTTGSTSNTYKVIQKSEINKLALVKKYPILSQLPSQTSLEVVFRFLHTKSSEELMNEGYYVNLELKQT
jgi:hypothetical protein